MPDAQELIESGKRYEKAGMLDRAQEEYEEAGRLSADPHTESLVFRRLSHVHRTRCDWDAAIIAARSSRQSARRANSLELEAEAVNAEAAVRQSQGQLKPAAQLYAEMLDLTANPRICAVALQNLGSIAATAGDLDRAESYFRHSRERFKEALYKPGEAIALNNLGRVTLDKGETEAAVAILREAVSAAQMLDDMNLLALAQVNYGDALAARGELADAEECVSAALGHFTMVANHWRRIECLRILGDVARRTRGAEEAEPLYRKAAQLAEQIGATVELEVVRQRLKDLR